MSRFRGDRWRNQGGAVMIFTFAAMVVLAVIVGGFLFMIATQTAGSGGGLTSTQALWVAEGGIQQALYSLKNDSSFRSSPTSPVTGSLGEGSYSVTVSKSGSTYALSSTGTVGELSRRIDQTVTVTVAYPAAFSYALFGNTNASTLQLKDNVTISGNLYVDGAVQIASGASVTGGLIYADSVSGSGSYTAASGPPDPVPTYPAFTTTSYDSQITTAESSASSDWTLSGSSSYSLGGGTVYYQSVTIKDSATITGPGTIVATGDVVLKDNASIGSGVTIITKADLTVKNDAVVQSGGILYGRESIELKDDASVTGSVLCPASGKTVTIKEDATLTGLVYANTLKLRDDAVVTGSVVANSYTSNKITDDVRVTYNASALPSTIPAGIPEGTVTVSPNTNWDEV